MQQNTNTVTVKTQEDRAYLGAMPAPKGDAVPTQKSSVTPGQRWSDGAAVVLVCDDSPDVVIYEIATGKRFFKGLPHMAEAKMIGRGFKRNG